jgi:hypothetical protein
MRVAGLLISTFLFSGLFSGVFSESAMACLRSPDILQLKGATFNEARIAVKEISKTPEAESATVNPDKNAGAAVLGLEIGDAQFYFDRKEKSWCMRTSFDAPVTCHIKTYEITASRGEKRQGQIVFQDSERTLWIFSSKSNRLVKDISKPRMKVADVSKMVGGVQTVSVLSVDGFLGSSQLGHYEASFNRAGGPLNSLANQRNEQGIEISGQWVKSDVRCGGALEARQLKVETNSLNRIPASASEKSSGDHK